MYVYPVTTLGSPKVLSTSSLESKDSKFVELQEVQYCASNGAERRWEAVKRKTRGKNAVADAVDIFTYIKHPVNEPHTIIVLQFRPAVNAISVEFPAGLIDEGETPEVAAIRELKEETGYGSTEQTQAVIREISVPCADSPGMSTESTVFVTMVVTLPDDTPAHEWPSPKQELDEGEFIEIRVVPVRGLYDILNGYQQLGYVVDTRLHHFAYGLKFAALLAKDIRV